MKIQEKVFIVTGGGNGIGRELVLALVHGGAKVAAVDINENALNETRQMAGDLKDRISIHKVDITDQQAVAALADQVTTTHGAVDGLINNAGIIQPFVRLNDLTIQQINQVLNVNLNGMIYMIKTFLPLLLQRPEAHIVNVSSMGGFLPVPGQTLYGASKAAVKLLTEGLHSELADTQVHVTLVFPGAIGTNIALNSGAMTPEMQAKQNTGRMKFTSPQSAAQQILAGMEKNKYHVLVGGDARFLDFFTRLAPQTAANFINQQMKSLLPQK